MRIKPGDTTDVTQTNLDATRGVRGVGSSPASDVTSRSSAPAGDSIALSTPGNLVQQAISSVSEARLARVAELQKLVQSGQYQVDSWSVSQSLIQAHLNGE
jgi:flagellar biosynthesis anti-sigma factor FlgM